ncbi:MAG: glycosyltransferase family 2 protein [Acetatifactor sp.]|nr:glycosyltransferase family 2 protein [Acetatifactor sp.]
MISISLCMIVKDEEAVLARCLGSVADLVDEIIIVDTGSTDRTKEIAAEYTDRIYDFQWINDFSAARNYAFSLASCDYIYSADADEVLDEENRERFRRLKEQLLPQVEIVQMKYGNQLQYNTVYNYDEEYRPKLFKRLRQFIWIEPIHETVRLQPIVYDSDIVITHKPSQGHGSRDLANFERQVQEGRRLSRHLHNMYARELLIAGEPEHFRRACACFEGSTEDPERSAEELQEAFCVLSRAYRLQGDLPGFFRYAMKAMAAGGCSELCIELGLYYEQDRRDPAEAAMWYYNAAYETEPILTLESGGTQALEGLVRCHRQMGQEEQAAEYERQLEESINEV